MAACRQRRRGSSEENLILREEIDESIGGDEGRTPTTATDEVFGTNEEGKKVAEPKGNGVVKNPVEKEEESGGGRKEKGERIATGVLDTINQKFESLDYEVNFNSLMLDEFRQIASKYIEIKVIWLVFFISFLFRYLIFI